MALLIYSAVPASLWIDALREASPRLDIRSWPDIGDPSDITSALVWKPDLSVLRALPNLRAIFSMGAGVDHILERGEFPKGVRLARIVDSGLSVSMSQYVCYHAIRYLRQFDKFQDAQRARSWISPPVVEPCGWNVGLLGFGVLGSHSARALKQLGFHVRALARSSKTDEVIKVFDQTQFDEFLSDTRLLICLLPLTRETKGILNKEVFNKLPRGAYLINVGRGAHQVELDILSALDDGQLEGATLDVFNEEPLPDSSPLWSHPKVYITPHCAADPDPKRAAPFILDNVRRTDEGISLLGEVDLACEY